MSGMVGIPRIEKIPFYMAYPMQNIYLEEMEYERDLEKMKRLYPKKVRKIQDVVEEECDKMEYEGSMMFDETPDFYQLKKICHHIYEKVSPQENCNNQSCSQAESQEIAMVGRRPPAGPPDFGPPRRPPQNRDSQLENLIEVLLFHEMHNRRCRHKRCRRFW